MSYKCVEEMLKRMGFTKFHRVDDPHFKRAIMVAGRVDHPIFSEADRIVRKPRVLTLARHTKRYLKTVGAILSGRINS
jgi:hypothetical protein